jgi:hypothetical protein
MDKTEEPVARVELRQAMSLQRLTKGREWRFALALRHIVGARTHISTKAPLI